MKKYETIIFLGFSGVGKTALANQLSHKYPHLFHRVVTNTTRSIREDEIDKIDYNFLSVDDFTNKIKSNDFIEYAKFNGNYYGTSFDNFNNQLLNIVVCEPSGVLPIYNNPKINVVNIINIEREYSIILNTINNESRMKQISSRRANREEEKEFEKLPLNIRVGILSFKNNSHSIEEAANKFNKIFNLTNLIDFSNYDLKSFIEENLNFFNKSLNKMRKNSNIIILERLISLANELLEDIGNSTKINFVSKFNIFMNEIDSLKLNSKKTINNSLTTIKLLNIYNRNDLKLKYDEIKEKFTYFNSKSMISTKKIIEFNYLENIIINLKNDSVPVEMHRLLTNNIEYFYNYFNILDKTITNNIILNSSFFIDKLYMHYAKHQKKIFSITIDSSMHDFLRNDALFKLFIYDDKSSKNKYTLNVLLDNENRFVVTQDHKHIFSINLDLEKLNIVKCGNDLEKLKNSDIKEKHLLFTFEQQNLINYFIDNHTDYNASLYIKNETLLENYYLENLSQDYPQISRQ